ncbi:tuftelin interacting protein [Cyclospora cayetanensis]|uniref:Tuftelin interacting protein n=1 Tax=Cyclospora cayetanensis TaxID=88456 RepID=A0A1D3D120_9EIME|nr:tuftelin interacting protein [Cyclospora cayetanensis]
MLSSLRSVSRLLDPSAAAAEGVPEEGDRKEGVQEAAAAAAALTPLACIASKEASRGGRLHLVSQPSSSVDFIGGSSSESGTSQPLCSCHSCCKSGKMGRSSRRARRKEAIYGCFGGSSSSDEGEEQPRGLAAATAASSRSSKRRRRHDSSDNSSDDDSSGPIQFVKGGRGWGEQQMQQTYGKGFAMLQRMGFKGGALGRDGTGLVAPIEVKLRKKNRALQDEGERLLPGEKGAAPIKVGGEDFPCCCAPWLQRALALVAAVGIAVSIAALQYQTLCRLRSFLGGKLLRMKWQGQRQMGELRGWTVSRKTGRVIDMTGPEVRLLGSAAEVGEALRQQQQMQREELLGVMDGSSSGMGTGVCACDGGTDTR